MSKGGGGGTNTVQKADPWAGQQPYLTDLYRQAQTQFQQGPQQFYPGRTYAEASPTVYQAEELKTSSISSSRIRIRFYCSRISTSINESCTKISRPNATRIFSSKS